MHTLLSLPVELIAQIALETSRASERDYFTATSVKELLYPNETILSMALVSKYLYFCLRQLRFRTICVRLCRKCAFKTVCDEHAERIDYIHNPMQAGAIRAMQIVGQKTAPPGPNALRYYVETVRIGISTVHGVLECLRAITSYVTSEHAVDRLLQFEVDELSLQTNAFEISEALDGACCHWLSPAAVVEYESGELQPTDAACVETVEYCKYLVINTFDALNIRYTTNLRLSQHGVCLPGQRRIYVLYPSYARLTSDDLPASSPSEPSPSRSSKRVGSPLASRLYAHVQDSFRENWTSLKA